MLTQPKDYISRSILNCKLLQFDWCYFLFQHFLGEYCFKSKTLRDEFSPEGLCKAAMYALLVKEELDSWPEQSLRQRRWLTVSEAGECCRHSWMKEALEEGFRKWLSDGMICTMEENNHILSSISSPKEEKWTLMLLRKAPFEAHFFDFLVYPLISSCWGLGG